VRPRRPIPFVRRCQKPLELRARKFVKRATQKNVNWLGRDALFLVADASGVTKARFVGSLSDKSWQATKSDKSSVRREAFAGLILLLGPHPVEIGPGTRQSHLCQDPTVCSGSVHASALLNSFTFLTKPLKLVYRCSHINVFIMLSDRKWTWKTRCRVSDRFQRGADLDGPSSRIEIGDLFTFNLC
jgi:hypothetical protein